jgi:hypothetical protein
VTTPQPGSYPPVRWTENGVGTGELGWLGSCSEWIFQIWRPSDRQQWELICNLPGSRTTDRDKSPDELKKTADRWLKWFLDDIHATRRYTVSP